MRSPLAVVLLALVLGGGLGCRKKSAPQYYDLESRYSVAIARDGDEAYTSSEMDGIVTGLTAIPPDAVEGPKARSVLEAIASARSRLEKEKADAARAIVPTVAPVIPADARRPPASTANADVSLDAGAAPSEPVGNMSLEDFTRYFGLCMVDVGPMDASGLTGKGRAFTNQDSVLCKAKLHLDDASKATYVFVEGRLAERRIERTTLVVIDAGPPPAPPPQEHLAPAPFVPGMPAPDDGRSAQDAG